MKKLIAILLAAAFAVGVYFAYQSGLIGQLSDYDELVETMRASGIRGPLICIAVQIAQVIVFPIPGEVTQIAAGYVFGAWAGFLYSWIGIMLGSAFAYGFARLVGRPVIQKLIGAKRIEKIDHVLASSKGRSALFLLFLVPGMPKDSLSFGVGLTDFRFAEFIVLSGLGRAPALLVSTMIGSQVHARDYTSIAITVVVAGLVIGAAYFYEKRRSAT
jgi:uncharacterized membrane protein YdjX (TVP38/TMEM64 family)